MMIIAIDAHITIIAVVDIGRPDDLAWLAESGVEFLLLRGLFGSWGEPGDGEPDVEVAEEEDYTTNNHNQEP